MNGLLIGRSAELGGLVRVLENAMDGSAGVALLGGDAGIGKTRLATELVAEARKRGLNVLVGQCAELGDALPYLPLADALRDPALADAVAARPILGQLLDDGSAVASSSGLTQQRLFGSLLGLLADVQPVLFVIEDLHWADRSTRDLLVFLSRMLQSERVCVVGTYRTDDLHRRHPLRPVLAELKRLPSVTAVELRPLGSSEMSDYVATLGEVGARGLGEIVARADGNPFYAEELFAAMAEGEALPDSLASLLLSRVELLSEPGQRVLRAAAVAGRRVEDSLLREVSGLPVGEFEEAVREIVSRGLLLVDGYGYAFRHALLQEAVYTDLLPGERTRLHNAFAARLTSPAELAHHHLAGHDLAGALTASAEAGRIAERLGAPAEAHRHYDQVIELWERVPDAEQRAGESRRGIAMRSAIAAADSGDNHGAVARLRAVPPTPEVQERLASYLWEMDQTDEAIAVAESAVATATEPVVLARALATLARCLAWSDRHAELEPLAERALATARSSGAADAEASALVTLASAAELRGDWARAESLFHMASSRASGNLAIDLRALFNLSRVHYDLGRLDQAAEVADRGIALAAEAGLSWSTYGTDLRFLRFLIHYVSGEWHEAEAMAARFPTRVGTVPESILSSFALFIEVARGLPKVGERLAWLQPFWSDPLVTYMSRGMAAEHALWNGDLAAALDHVEAVMGILTPNDPATLRVAATGLAVLAELGRTKGADELIARARYAASTGPDGERGEMGLEGRAWRLRAEAEWSRAHGRSDPDRWREVVEAFSYGFVYEVARSRWRLSEALLATGDRAAAQQEWTLARETAAKLGAAPFAAALEEFGRRARFVGATSTGGLTAREVEVLALVAEGLGNREIGERLFIAQKTVSVHVSNILGKLDASTRTQAAAIARKQGLLP
ncbi:helix-turn-helix transcriptional regulator [Nonomuraea sp. NPDC059194]|uniref:helix-turn-helix transcriptional regulator n=1 Tax=Nonomuraea sp. NPDC059194 TaxID=3346764 RepID=UPI00367421C6